MPAQGTIDFSANCIIIDDLTPTIADFDVIQSEESDEQIIGDQHEVIGTKKIVKEVIDGRFICISSEEGSRFPYSATVYDVEQAEELDNPRSSTQIEFSDQFFALIDITNLHLYVSNQRKRTAFINWLQDKIGKPIVSKAIIKEDQFLENVNTIGEISFSVEPSLFASRKGSLQESLLQDIYGFGADEAQIILKYKKKKLGDQVRGVVNELISKKADFKELSITGRSDEHFTTIFNTDGIISKIRIFALQDPNTQKFLKDEVFAQLIKIIKQND